MKTRHALSLVALLGGGVWLWSAQAQEGPGAKQAKAAASTSKTADAKPAPSAPLTADDIFRAVNNAVTRSRQDTTWEYRSTEELRPGDANRLGMEGWELVCVTGTSAKDFTMFWKKPL